jgi:hypothetical protein
MVVAELVHGLHSFALVTVRGRGIAEFYVDVSLQEVQISDNSPVDPRILIGDRVRCSELLYSLFQQASSLVADGKEHGRSQLLRVRRPRPGRDNR